MVKMKGKSTDIMVGTMLKTKNLFKLEQIFVSAGATASLHLEEMHP